MKKCTLCSGNTPRGAKVRLTGRVRLEAGLLTLEPRNVQLLGGRLAEVGPPPPDSSPNPAPAPRWRPLAEAQATRAELDQRWPGFGARPVLAASRWPPPEQHKEESDASKQFRRQRRRKIEQAGAENPTWKRPRRR